MELWRGAGLSAKAASLDHSGRPPHYFILGGLAVKRMSRDSDGGSRPVPDPTVLTTEALMREVASLKELLELRISNESAARYSAIQNLSMRMDLTEQQRVELKRDTKNAVDAAFAAAKEAVREQTTASALSIAKSEGATNEQLRQLSTTFTTAVDGVTRNLDDAKDRINKLEQMQAKLAGKGIGQEKSWGMLLGSIAATGTLVGIVVVIIEVFITH